MTKTPNERSSEEREITGTPAVSVAPDVVSIERPGLYIVATPIGNLGDFSPRAAAVLAAVDTVLCEDTRHSRHLLERYGIRTPLAPCHEHNERAVAQAWLARLGAQGEAAALICDAGTPLVSDPGYVLVREAAAAGVPVFSVPGPSAVLAALSISGLPSDRFVFEGFLAARARARRERLQALAEERRTLVFYEAPHRLLATLADLRDALGAAREAAVARELTKRFETVYRGTLGELAAALAHDRDAVRGELVIVVRGAPEAPAADAGLAALDRTLGVLLAETDRKTALRIATALTGLGRNAVYRRMLERERGRG